MSQVRLLQGDCRAVLPTLPEASVDAIVTDPPYELGFMGRTWDTAGVTFDIETWRQALRVLRPGGHLLAFGGTRTYHRMAVAIEDAGFDIRDQIGWAYGSGFPKSKNLDGNWQGWGTALKPAWEPIVVARKPLVGTVEVNVLVHGTGALNIDGCRVPTDDNLNGRTYAKEGGLSELQSLHGGTGMNVAGKTAGRDFVQPTGRWPANLIHDGSEEVLSAFPPAPGQQGRARTDGKDQGNNVFGNLRYVANHPNPRGDFGSAARFFYCAKASRKDRGEGNAHPTVKPTELMRYLCRLVTPPGGTVLDPFAGSGSTLKAAELEGINAIGIELMLNHIEIIKSRLNNFHPVRTPVYDPMNLFKETA